MGARENKCQISQHYILHMKFSEFYQSCVFIILVKLDIHFLGLFKTHAQRAAKD